MQRVEEAQNVEILFNTNFTELRGEGAISEVVVTGRDGATRTLPTDGIFIEIGADPNSGLAKAIGAELNETGEIVVDKGMAANVPGVFAGGDVTDASGDLKQTVTAVAEGAIAATSAYEYVAKQPFRCTWHARGMDLEKLAA